MWYADFVSFGKSCPEDESVNFGFVVKIDIDSCKLDEFKEKHPVLKDTRAIKIEIEERATVKQEKGCLW